MRQCSIAKRILSVLLACLLLSGAVITPLAAAPQERGQDMPERVQTSSEDTTQTQTEPEDAAEAEEPYDPEPEPQADELESVQPQAATISDDDLFFKHPRYLDNDYIDEGYGKAEAACFAVLNSYSGSDEVIAACMQILKDGIISTAIMQGSNRIGITQSRYESCLDAATRSFLKQYLPSSIKDDLADIVSDVESKYKVVKDLYSFNTAVTKAKLVQDLTTKADLNGIHLSRAGVEKVADKIYGSKMIKDLLDAAGYATHFAQIAVTMMELYSIEAEYLDFLLNELSAAGMENLDLYTGISTIRAAASDASTYIFDRYIYKDLVKLVIKSAKKLFNTMSSLVGLTETIASMLAKYVYEGATADDLITCYQHMGFCAALDTCITKYRTKFRNGKGTQDDKERYLALFTARNAAYVAALQQCSTASRIMDRFRLGGDCLVWASNLQSSYTVDNYLSWCKSAIQNDISNGTIDSSGETIITDALNEQTIKERLEKLASLPAYKPNVGKQWSGKFDGVGRSLGFAAMVFNTVFDKIMSPRVDSRYQYTGEYELCPEGQYYFLVAATMPGSTREETVKLPVKLDITAPEIDVVSAAYENGALTVTFRAEDNVGVYGEIELYVNGESEYVMLSDCAYDEASGLYTCTLDEPSAYRAGEMNEIGVFAQDYAMNNTTAYLYTGVDETADIVYATLTNTEDSWFDSFQLYDRSDLGEMYSEDEIAELAFDWDIRGSVSERVASLTVDGENVLITAKHSFSVKKAIEPGENAFQVVAKDASGKTLVQETKLLYLSTKSGVTARIYPECYPNNMEALCPETNRPANAWLDQAGFFSGWRNGFGYLTHYKTVAPLVFECSDPIKEVSIIYYDPDQTLASDALMKSYDETIYMEDVKYKTMTLTQEDFVDGKAAFDMPMVPWDLDMSDYINIDPANYPDTRVNECYITVTNVLGVKSYYFVRVENDDVCRLSEDRGQIEDMNILDDPDSIVSLMGFEWLKPMDDMQFPFVFTPEDLDAEGRIHVTGKAADDAVLEVYANGEYVSVDDPMEFAFDFKLNPGVNYMSIFTVEDFGTTSSTTYRLFYLPEPTTLSFDQSGVADGATIYTTDSSFLLSGSVTSYFAGRELAINGDNVIFEDGAVSTPAGQRHAASFSKTIDLQLGENIVTVEMVDAAGLKVKVTFTIIRSEKTPDTPVIVIPTRPGTGSSKFPFTDIGKNDGYYDAVKYLYENEIMNGTSSTLFSPNAELTRGMVVTILYRIEGEPLTKSSGTFSDVTAGRYYSEAVEWAAEKEIVNGFSDGTFKPERSVTREQLASILRRYARFSGIATYDAELPANASVSNWAKKDVAWAYAKGILTSVQTAAAAKNANRAEVAMAIYAYLTGTAK